MIRRWGRRATLALADQALLSVTGLGLQVLLGRFLPPQQYGGFAIAYTILLMVLGAHTALVTEPLTVLVGRHPDTRERFTAALLRWHHRLVAGMTGASAAMTALLLALGHPLASTCLGLTLTFPGYLLFNLVRRIAYLHLDAGRALSLTVIFSVSLVAALAGLLWWGGLSTLTAWIALAAANGASALGWYVRSADPKLHPDWRKAARQAWSYGRWILAANLAHWLGMGMYVPAVGLMLGLGDAGTFRALQNLTAPVAHGLSAAALLGLPWLTRRVGSQKGANSAIGRLLAATVPPSLLYALSLAVFGSHWMELLYDQESYTRASHLLWLFAVSVLLLPLTQCLTLTIRALDRPRLIFWSKAAATGTTFAVGLPLVAHLGLAGAVVGLLASQLAETLLLTASFIWRPAP